MSTTSTFTSSDTYTEARAKYVMGKIFDDFNHLVVRGFSSPSRTDIQNWREDLFYLMVEKKLKKFQIKFKFSGGGEEAWEYILKSDNTIQADNKSGGKDLYGYPDSTEVSIVISYDKSSTEINDYMTRRGWVSGAVFLSGTSEFNRAYSKEGYGVINNIIKK